MRDVLSLNVKRMTLYSTRGRPADGVHCSTLDAYVIPGRKMDRSCSSLTVADVEAMGAGASKQRHEIQDGRIRAIYGHSLPGRVELVPATPPVELFHGTSPTAAEMIRVEGCVR